MTVDVETYQLTWIIRIMGLWVHHDSGTSPDSFGGRPIRTIFYTVQIKLDRFLSKHNEIDGT